MAAAKRDTANVAAKNKRIRQEAMREKLAAGGLVQQVLETAKKLHDGHLTLESSQIQALKAAAELRLKLVGKYLPDLKAIEIEGNVSNDSHEDWLKKLEE